MVLAKSRSSENSAVIRDAWLDFGGNARLTDIVARQCFNMRLRNAIRTTPVPGFQVEASARAANEIDGARTAAPISHPAYPELAGSQRKRPQNQQSAGKDALDDRTATAAAPGRLARAIPSTFIPVSCNDWLPLRLGGLFSWPETLSETWPGTQAAETRRSGVRSVSCMSRSGPQAYGRRRARGDRPCPTKSNSLENTPRRSAS